MKNLTLSPSNGPLKFPTPFPNPTMIQWLEQAFPNDREVHIPCAAFQKQDLFQMMNGLSNKDWICFFKVKMPVGGTEQQTRHTLAAAGVAGNQLQTSGKNPVLVANNFPSPTRSGAMSIEDFQINRQEKAPQPAKANLKQLTVMANEFQQILSELQNFDSKRVNHFLTVKFDVDQLSALGATSGCDRIAFMPVLVDFEVEKDITDRPGLTIPYKFDMTSETLLAAAIDGNDQILGQPVISATSWIPLYPPYN